MGRVNYGPKLCDRKGIHGVRFECQHHFGWEMYPLKMTDLSGLEFLKSKELSVCPKFLRGYLKISSTS